MGCVFRAKGRSIYWFKWKSNGKWQYESSHSTREGDAKRLLRLREGDVARGLPVTSQIGRMKFEEARDDLIAFHKANGRETKKLEGRIKKHLTPFFGCRKMTDINGALVNKYIADRLESGAKAGTINRELAWLKHMYSLAMKSGKLMTKPHISLLREDNARDGFFEPDQFRSVLRALPDDLKPVIEVAYYTGWRIKDELLTLKWKQVTNGQLRLEHSKNGEGRTFPYAQIPELKRVIEAQWALHEKLKKQGRLVPYVFHRNGVSILSMGKAFKAACKRAGVPGRIMHDFRRTAVRNLELAGVPRSQAMKLTGHKTESVYRRYAIASNADLEVAAQRLALLTSELTSGRKIGGAARI